MTVSKKFIIVKDRVEIYRDFTLNLLYYINDYYLDKETLYEEEDIRNHFTWCYNKVCDEFKEENIDFSKNKILKEYFYTFYLHQIYNANDYQDTSLNYFENFWKNIFDIDKHKKKNIMNVLIEIYNNFDKSVNIEKNILEIV